MVWASISIYRQVGCGHQSYPGFEPDEDCDGNEDGSHNHDNLKRQVDLVLDALELEDRCQEFSFHFY